MTYDVHAIRDHFPSLGTGFVFFDGPGGTQTPDTVGAAISAAITGPLSNRSEVTVSGRNAESFVTEARGAMADLLRAEPDGIVFGRSATALHYILARALAKTWGSGDEIAVSRLDHDSHVRPWIQAAEAAGATIRWIDFDPDTAEMRAEHVAAAMGERTRLVAVTGASNLIGTMPDIRAIAAVVHEAGALLSVDGVHRTAHEVIDISDLGADFYTCSPYKFFGPHLGVLAADPELLETIHPDKLLPSTDRVPERFEFGTLPYELLAGVTAAVDFLAGLDPAAAGTRRERLVASITAAAAYEDQLRDRIERDLRTLPGVVMHSRATRRTPTLLITFADHDAADAFAFLATRGINAPAGNFYAIETSRHLGLGDAGGLRIGLAPYNTPREADALIVALREFLGLPPVSAASNTVTCHSIERGTVLA